MKYILTILFLSITIITYSQIQVYEEGPKTHLVGEVKSDGIFQYKMTYKVVETDTIYTIMYKNAKYPSIADVQSLDFSSKDNTLEILYTVLQSVFIEENKKKAKNKHDGYNITLKLGETTAMISGLHSSGTYSGVFRTLNGFFFYTPKQIAKLFGKSKKQH